MAMNPRLLRPRQTGFDPRSISGLGLWLDASADSSLTFNASTVSEWRDLSGNGRHFSQATGASQPGTGTLNGRRVLSTTGSQLMTGNAASLGILRNVPGATIVYVGSLTATDLQNLIQISNGTNIGQARAMMGRISNFVVAGRRLDADSFASAGLLSGGQSSGVYTGVLDYANSDAFLFGNGTQLASNTSFQADGNTSDTASLGASLFATPGGTNFCTGTLGEVLIYARALSAAERQRVERYLGRKWGITLAPQVSNADAQDWVNRVYANGGTVSATTAEAVNQFCNAIDAAGIRDRFFRLNLFCGNSDASLAAVRTPLFRGPSLAGTQYGGTTDTNNNFVAGDYAETGGTGGLTGNGSTKFLNTGLKQNEINTSGFGHLSVFARHASYTGTNSYRMIGLIQTSPTNQWYFLDTRTSAGTPTLTRALGVHGGGNNIDQGAGAGNQSGGQLMTITRASDSDATVYVNATSVATDTTTRTISAVNADLYVFAENRVGTGAQTHSAMTFGGYSMGLSLTASQVSAFQSAMAAFQTTLNRNSGAG